MMAGRVGNAFLPTKIYPKGINRKTTQARQGLGGLAMIRQVNGGQKSVAHPWGYPIDS